MKKIGSGQARPGLDPGAVGSRDRVPASASASARPGERGANPPPSAGESLPRTRSGGREGGRAAGAEPTAHCPLPTAGAEGAHPIWCQTFTGRAFPLLAPTPADIDWRDIAASLAKQCRYNGHCQTFFSVAQHSVLAAEFAANPKLWDAEDARIFAMAIEAVGRDRLFRAVLLHDAPESYIGDLTTPMKQAMRALGTVRKATDLGKTDTQVYAIMLASHGLTAFDTIEDGIAAAVSQKADLPWPLGPAVEAAVKRADLKMLATELRDLMAPPPRSWRIPLDPIRMPAIRPLLPGPAEADFLHALDRAGLDPRG